MLNVALFDVLSQEVEIVFLRFIYITFFLVIFPKRMPPVPYLGQTHNFEEIGHKILPYFVNLLHLSLNKGNKLIGRLLDPPLQMPKTIVNHLINDLPTLCVNTHATQWIFGVETNREVLTDGVDLVTSE